MTHDVLYLIGIVAVGWAVTVGLRALPFLLFAGRDRELPKSIERFGAFISPIIIAALIVYSYSSLAWRTPYPYLAGLLTVGLQLLVRNPLASIIAGTALYMSLLSAGCTSVPTVQLDMRDPSIVYSDFGIKIGDTPVKAEDVVKILRENDIPSDRVIHVRIETGTKNLSGARMLLSVLARGGYTRPVLVSELHSASYATGKKKAPEQKASSSNQQKKIRYKKAKE